MTERYVFLFDGLIILTKQNTKRSSVTGPVGDYKLKEKFQMRKVDIIDKEDTEGKQTTPHTKTKNNVPKSASCAVFLKHSPFIFLQN